MTKYKNGDKVVITDRICGHNFNIGEAVMITYVCKGGDYDATNGKDNWFVTDKEVKEVDG